MRDLDALRKCRGTTSRDPRATLTSIDKVHREN